MLIQRVHAMAHAWATLFPAKRSLQPVGPSSSTLLGWFRPAPIDQYSSLLPPVGVWTVSQFQCGGPSSQNPYPYPSNYLMERIPIRHRWPLAVIPCGITATSGINLPFGRLYRGAGQVGYALLTRAPVAIRGIAAPMLPRDLHVLSL